MYYQKRIQVKEINHISIIKNVFGCYIKTTVTLHTRISLITAHIFKVYTLTK